MATATNAELLGAVCKAIKQSPAEVGYIVKVAGSARKSLRAEILCRAVRCAEGRSVDCTWVVGILRNWIRDEPSEANHLLEMALECAPDCRAALGDIATGSSGGSTHHGARAAPTPNPHTIAAEPHETPQGTPPPEPEELEGGAGVDSVASDTRATRNGNQRASASIPEFKIPPPLASASREIPRELLIGGKPTPLLGDVEATLNAAFEQCDYTEKSYYALREKSGLRDGFALASRMERMNPDGSTNPQDRWLEEVPPMRKFSISDYVGALFRARPGHYRVIVFVLTNKPLTQDTDARASSDQAKLWPKKGADSLPKEMAEMEYTADYKCTALIYEFKSLGGGEAKFVEPSEINGRIHLEKSGLWTALTQRR